MSDRELLQAIGDLMDKKLDARFEAFEKKMDEKLDARFEAFEKKMDEKMAPIYSELKNLHKRVKKLELLVENSIIPRLQNIESCYISTFERYRKDCERMEDAFVDIDILKKTVKEHSLQLQMIS